MSLNVTRCPQCGSTFNFSPRQLESSRGRARCGACLHIFLPEEHLAAPEREDETADSVFIGRTPEEYATADTPAEATGEAVESSAEITAPEEPEEPEQEAQQPAPAPPRPAPREPKLSNSTGNPFPEPPVSRPAAARQSHHPTDPQEKFEFIPQRNPSPPRQFQPVMQRRPARRFNWSVFVGQSTLALMLLVLLAAQYLWRNLPTFSQIDWLRPGYALICARAGCELPPYAAIDRIQSMGANLRAHPDHPDAYLLTARMYNTAQFPQAYPVLILLFTSADGRNIALREFAPAEYLNSPAPESSLLPPDTPTEIELEVIAPTPATTNFEVAFRRASPAVP